MQKAAGMEKSALTPKVTGPVLDKFRKALDNFPAINRDAYSMDSLLSKYPHLADAVAGQDAFTRLTTSGVYKPLTNHQKIFGDNKWLNTDLTNVARALSSNSPSVRQAIPHGPKYDVSKLLDPLDLDGARATKLLRSFAHNLVHSKLPQA